MEKTDTDDHQVWGVSMEGDHLYKLTSIPIFSLKLSIHNYNTRFRTDRPSTFSPNTANMKFASALTSLLAIGATAAPAAEPETGDVQDLEARHYSCGRDAYWKDNCCKCKIEGQVYNKYWHGCNWP